jgi:hypothetical protein
MRQAFAKPARIAQPCALLRVVRFAATVTTPPSVPMTLPLRPDRSPRALLAAVLLLSLLAGRSGAQGSSSFPQAPVYNDGVAASRYLPRVAIFFPPNPPPLGRAVSAAAAQSGRLTAPQELAAHVNEIFYPPLGTRLATKTLNDKLRAQLEQYRAAKTALQAELHKELERLRDAEPAARAGELAAFARRQTPKIAELEKSAEQLRRDLITRDTTWSAVREWRLGDSAKRGFSPLEIAQVMRSYAFYQNGLLPAQRRLLREISLELAMAADSTDKATAAQPYLFFPPEPARVLLPDDAPAEVAAKMAAYQTKKSLLKKELYDTVYSHDGEKFAFLGSTLKRLADKQAPRIAELEKLAEEIRVGLAEVPEPARVSERSPLPPTLQARAASLVVHLDSAQKEAAAKIRGILAEARDVPMQSSYRFEADGLKYVIIASAGGRGGRGGRGTPPSPEDRARVEAVRAQFAAVADAYGRTLADAVNERDALAVEIGRSLGTSKPEAVNTALMTAIRVATARENENAYRHYRVAVFQPGLSPEQRRLLFDGVVENLQLPLPRGELQPVQRASTW